MDKLQTNAESNIQHVIGIMSGKGGVGKSSISALLAAGLHKAGHRVGVLDADITGASIPKILGTANQRMQSQDNKILPAETDQGIKVVSLNLMLENEDDPVIWRGPLIAGAVRQFWTDVLWGELDYLVVDMPPGTGDSPLTVLQSLPVDGVVMVTTPQDLTTMVVRKALKMTNMLGVPVLGIVENMSHLVCPDCGKRIDLFGPSHAQSISTALSVKLLAQLPVNPHLTELCDQGRVYDYQAPAVDNLVESIKKELTK